jgi:hypothetical protein
MANNVDLNIRTNADKAAASMTKLNTSIVDQVKKVQQLEKGYKVLDNAFNKGLISAQKYAKGTQQVDKAIKQAINSQNKLASSTQQVSKKLNQKSMILQQTGLQLGDLAVQVQSGTSFLLAFGQQATQLIGTFSLLAKSTKMIALFSGLGVIVPIATAIAGSFLRMGDSAKTASDKVSELKNSLNAIKNIQAARMAGPTEMFSRFGDDAQGARERLDLQLRFEIDRAKSKAVESFDTVKALSEEFQTQYLKNLSAALLDDTQQAGAVETQLGFYEARVNKLAESFRILPAEAEKVFRVLADAAEATTLDEQIKAGEALRKSLSDAGASYEGLDKEQANFVEGFLKYIEQVSNFERTRKDIEENTSQAARDLQATEEASLARNKELLELEIQHGKESTKYRDKIQEFELKAYQAALRKKITDEGILKVLVDQKRENQELANESERVADASERTEKAISRLRGFGESLSMQLVRVRAEVEALETGQDPGTAGQIATLGERFRIAIKDAIEGGVEGYDLLDLGQDLASQTQQIEVLLKKKTELEEKLRKQEEAKRKAEREARKLGPAGPKLMEDSVKEFFKLGDFEKQLELERELLFVTEDRARVLRQFGLDFAQRNPEIIAGLEEQIRATREISQIGSVVQQAFEDGFVAIVEGSKSVVGAFKDMARLIIKELFKILVVQRTIGRVASDGQVGSGILGFAENIFGKKASGGTMRANMPYLVGERGPELVMPAHQGSIYNADLTSKAMNGSSKITQVFNFNLSANGDDSVKKIVAQAAPQIADMAQKGVIAARRRGGTMRSTFG